MFMLEEKRYFAETAEMTRFFGQDFGSILSPKTVVCFRGDLGAGKTTFIQGILTACGAQPPFVSPTFVLMKEYDLTVPTPSGIRRIYHADAYRMERAEDFEKIGFLEWCADPEGLVLLEWPERIESLLPRHRTEIKLDIGEENLESRKIFIRVL